MTAADVRVKGNGSIRQVYLAGRFLGSVIHPQGKDSWFVMGDSTKTPHASARAAAEALAKGKGGGDGAS